MHGDSKRLQNNFNILALRCRYLNWPIFETNIWTLAENNFFFKKNTDFVVIYDEIVVSTSST